MQKDSTASAPAVLGSVTGLLIVLNVLVFVSMVLRGASLLQPTSDQLLRWGANFGPFTLDGQPWRALSAMFLHIGIVHLALNMWCLWELGTLAEHLYGSEAFAALYMLTGLTGSVASVAHNPLGVTAGASGAIFGVAGALIATLYLAHLSAPRHSLRIGLASLIVFAGYSLIYGFYKGGIDNAAHVGGLVSGLLLGAGLSRDFSAALRPRWRALLFPGFALLLLAAALGVRAYHGPVVEMEKAEALLRKGDAPGAIRVLDNALKARPGYAPAWYLLGTADLGAHRPDEAEKAFLHVLQLRPSDTVVRTQLALLYLKAGRIEKARDMYQAIANANPKDAQAWYDLGITLNQLESKQEAAEVFRKVTQLQPKMLSAWFNLGLNSMYLKRYDDAVAAFTQVTKLNPTDPEGWVWLANAYEAKGQAKQADAAYFTSYRLRAQQQRGQPQRRR